MGRQKPEPDHLFGSSPRLTVGVEEELLLVDPGRRAFERGGIAAVLDNLTATTAVD